MRSTTPRRATRALLVAAATVLAAPSLAAGPAPAAPAPEDRSAPRAGPAERRPATTDLLATRPHVPLHPCPDDDAWLCGSVGVPLDRTRPHGRQLRVAFAVLPHADQRATARDAVFSSDGGPGIANLAADSRGFQRFLLGELNEQRDVVVVDHRGTGRSGAIDCRRLQRVIGDLAAPPEQVVRAIGACGRQLGDASDRYGSGDVAMDLDAVRRALGYDHINLYGLSYAGAFLAAYATRFGAHLRSVVVDAGVPTSDRGHAWTWGRGIPRATATVVARHCRLAPACRAAQPQRATALARLAAHVRQTPVTGTVPVPGGPPRSVTVDELALVGLSRELGRQGDLAAAARALDEGDPAPLLRLGAETFAAPYEPADPAVDSAGDNVAVNCSDQDFVWDRSDPLPVRERKYRAALRRLGPDAFAPFSPQAWTDHFLSRYCIRWPAPDRHVPAVPRGATSGVPTLLLTGDLDTVVPTAIVRKLREVFPRAHLLRVAGAAHPAAGWSSCARGALTRFVRTLAAPARGACSEPALLLATTSAFPDRVAEAVPATATAGNAATGEDLRVVTAAVQTVRDAWQCSFRAPGDTGPLAGLRGGTGRYDYAGADDHAEVTLDRMRFTTDLEVTGSSELAYEGDRLSFDVTLTGPGGLTGHLTGQGRFGFGLGVRFADFVVSGVVGGHAVRATVPAN